MKASETLQSMSTWNKGKSAGDILKNSQAADRTFTMLLCARIFILKQFVESLPLLTDATTARRRWVLAQVLPPRLDFTRSDLFAIMFKSLRNASVDAMGQIIRSMLQFVTTKRRDLFPEGPETKLFVVIDEAQVAADHLKEYFRSTTATDMRPILHELYRFLLEFPAVVGGIILSGTGLSMQMAEKKAVGAVSAKRVDIKRTQVITDVGRFDDSSQEAYIRRYITLSDGDSDSRLLERIKYWFVGRYVHRRCYKIPSYL